MYDTVRSSNYHLLVPYPYNTGTSRTTTVMSRRSQLKTGKSTYTEGYFSLISSRQSSKATNYVDRSATQKKHSPESIRFPPITSTISNLSNAESVESKKSTKTKKRVHINEKKDDNRLNGEKVDNN